MRRARHRALVGVSPVASERCRELGAGRRWSTQFCVPHDRQIEEVRMSDDLPSVPPPGSGAYRSVVLLLLAAAIAGAVLAGVSGLALRNPVVVDAALALLLASSALLGVAWAEATRAHPREPRIKIRDWQGGLGIVCVLGLTVALAARWSPPRPLSLAVVATVLALILAAAGVTGSAATYLAAVDPERLPEGPGLSRGARVLAWVLVAAALAVALAWAGVLGAVRALHLLVLALDTIVCCEFLFAARAASGPGRIFPSDVVVLSVLGSRANPLASAVDAAERQLGIDLRSTWALALVRRSAEPLVVGLLAIGWLSTSATVVGLEEQGLVEHLGVAVGRDPLAPGLHFHWPWPVDRVVRIPVQRVQTLHVGHEGEEKAGPENVLWAREHGEAEYTLLLGNGRDLIAVDAAVQFLVSDPRAWRYRCQNPAEALRAIAYRAVMKSTVGLTLTQALSENVSALAGQMRAVMQADADLLGLGISVVGFTVGGMHPPVLVATDYQAVVSAALSKTTATIDAQAYRNAMVPAAEADAVRSENVARAEGALAAAKAAGDAWSFRALESSFLAAPQEYRFRRRLEALESGLAGRHYTVLDARIQRDGGDLWLMK
jgi:regulator of protease activity HflC (stomatin/prohibitin superfamily)